MSALTFANDMARLQRALAQCHDIGRPRPRLMPRVEQPH